MNSWNVSAVSNMAQMFDNAVAFDQPLDAWDVSFVFRMDGMFSNAAAFNQPLDAWDVSTKFDISAMFFGASSFNQSLCAWGPFLTSAVDTASMFEGSSCLTMNSPNFNVLPPGPFCHFC